MKSKHMMLAGLTIGLTTFATSAFAQAAEGYAHHGQMMWSGGAPHGWFGGPLMVLGVILLIVVVVLVVARIMGCTGGRCGHQRSGGTAIAILEERFAKGEIDKAEFEERKAALKS